MSPSILNGFERRAARRFYDKVHLYEMFEFSGGMPMAAFSFINYRTIQFHVILYVQFTDQSLWYPLFWAGRNHNKISVEQLWRDECIKLKIKTFQIEFAGAHFLHARNLF